MKKDEIIKDLEHYSLRNGSALGYHSGIIDNAVTLIEQQQAEIEHLQVRLGEIIEQQRAEIKQIELRVLESFIRNMPKTYRKRTENWAVVKNILQTGGQTRCVAKCCELGIEPYGYTLERVKDE